MIYNMKHQIILLGKDITSVYHGIKEFAPDHVHLLLSIDPQLSVHRAIKRIKGRSSHDLREEFPWLKSRIPTLWTNSYFVSTVGGAPLAQVRKYIERQKEV